MRACEAHLYGYRKGTPSGHGSLRQHSALRAAHSSLRAMVRPFQAQTLAGPERRAGHARDALPQQPHSLGPNEGGQGILLTPGPTRPAAAEKTIGRPRVGKG